MKKRAVVAGALALALVALALAGAAAPAFASTCISWRATFAEPLGGPAHSPFACPPNSSCSSGSGEVIPLGQAQSFIAFQACGETCDVRTLTFVDGSTIVMYETFSFVGTPGASNRPNPSYGHPFVGSLTDTIVGGTGRFAGATGAANGMVKVAGGIATSRLDGTVTF
jgi:hypothetical protein